MDTAGLIAVRARMADSAIASGRRPDEIDLVIVSKLRSDEDVLSMYEAGHRTFGENRQQGLKARIEADLPEDIAWHFIGPLQSRKVRYVASHAALLHSLDRLSLAQRWVNADGGPVLIQFNVANEPQKSGFDPADAVVALDAVLASGADVRGVMAIPPVTPDPTDVTPWFRLLRTIFEDYQERVPDITVCSMGMTNDLEIAIQEGATTIRVGRAIFGDINNNVD